MPSEFRKLVFTDDEVMDALEAHDDAASGRLDGRVIARLASDSVDDGELIATLAASEDGEEGDQVVLPDFYVTAALMRFLIEEGIPLPRRATKAITIENGQVVLQITVDHEEDGAAVAA